MADAARKLFDEALALPEDERELLAQDLLASLEPSDPEWERAWDAELGRRLVEVRDGALRANVRETSDPPKFADVS